MNVPKKKPPRKAKFRRRTKASPTARGMSRSSPVAARSPQNDIWAENTTVCVPIQQPCSGCRNKSRDEACSLCGQVFQVTTAQLEQALRPVGTMDDGDEDSMIYPVLKSLRLPDIPYPSRSSVPKVGDSNKVAARGAGAAEQASAGAE